jgi:hypothetical protein
MTPLPLPRRGTTLLEYLSAAGNHEISILCLFPHPNPEPFPVTSSASPKPTYISHLHLHLTPTCPDLLCITLQGGEELRQWLIESAAPTSSTDAHLLDRLRPRLKLPSFTRSPTRLRIVTHSQPITLTSAAMATLGLDDDELKSVEQIVFRLSQLASSIQSLKMDILKSHPLPHP